jgi:hypothetical protein
MEKFNALGFTFETIHLGSRIKDREGNFLAEIDLILENDDIVIAVEVKAKPAYSDIKDHITRMEVLRQSRCPGRQTHVIRGNRRGNNER